MRMSLPAVPGGRRSQTAAAASLLPASWRWARKGKQTNECASGMSDAFRPARPPLLLLCQCGLHCATLRLAKSALPTPQECRVPLGELANVRRLQAPSVHHPSEHCVRHLASLADAQPTHFSNQTVAVCFSNSTGVLGPIYQEEKNGRSLASSMMDFAALLLSATRAAYRLR